CGELEGIRPRVVVLLIGANDVRANSPEQVAEGIADIIGVIRDRLPSTRTLLLSLLPQDRYETERRASIARVNELIRELHDGEHVIFLEVSGEFLSANGQVSEEIMSDFLHLTPRGYEIFADAIHPVLVDLLAGAEQR
ncbi:MAG: GDSL-type esterase/lipase family protein, partial [Acidobacteriota bacterium]|nr:GDSL-type esterase/lipase family protein [Acidobacteriota bacterium]